VTGERRHGHLDRLVLRRPLVGDLWLVDQGAASSSPVSASSPSTPRTLARPGPCSQQDRHHGNDAARTGTRRPHSRQLAMPRRIATVTAFNSNPLHVNWY
jgi:hypothetical protein